MSLRADATAPDWTWESSGVLRWRTQWAPGSGEAPGRFAEATDQIQLRSLLSWRGLRGGLEGPTWFVPDPFVELFVETELTEPEGRDWHWLLLRPTAGLRFPLTAELELKLQGGVQGQLFQPGTELEAGLGAVVTLRRWELFHDGDRRVTMEGLVDWFFLDPGDRNLWQLRGSLDAALDLDGPLALTLGVRAYVQQDGGRDVGLALDATAGLRLGWLARALGP